MNLFINNDEIEQVQNFEYLGLQVSAELDSLMPVFHRINKGWAAFYYLMKGYILFLTKKLLTSKRIPATTKIKIYNTYMLLVVLYGLECATWTKTSATKLETFQNDIMRFMNGHKLQDHITIESLSSQTKLKPISAVIKERKLKFLAI